MKYATFGTNGRLNGRYDSNIHKLLPNGAVEITEDLFFQSINDQVGYLELANEAATWVVPSAKRQSQVIADLKLHAFNRINATYEAAVNALTAGYPASEISSWPKQEAEARAWVANDSVSTSWMDAAATARGITKADLAARIISHADLFSAASGQLSGKRQKLRNQIAAFGDDVAQAQLDAIQW